MAQGFTWRGWLGASLGMVAMVLLCIGYVDRPLARILGAHSPFHHFLTAPSLNAPILIVLAAAALMLALGYRALGQPFPRWMVAATIAGLALMLSVTLTELVLKPVFGRTLPSAYLHGGEYGFHWFHPGRQFGSFPSGHSDQVAAILAVFWAFYPRWRWLYAAVFLLLSLALMAGQWHFLSDIIAGAYVGVAAGAVTMWGWNAGVKRRRAGA